MTSDEKILIVDDDPDIRALLKKVLEQMGYACLQAQDGQALFDQWADQRIALVLLDIKLPGQDGLTLLPQILSRDPDVGVVMITGVVDIQTALTAIRSGAFDYIAKPFGLGELQIVLSRALEKRRLEMENKLYHESLREKNLRLEILHRLSVKIAFSLLSTVELEEIFRTILVGITAGEGLGLNRAFLALFDEGHTRLIGKFAIGPDSPEEAGRIWASLQEKQFGLAQVIEEYGRTCQLENTRVNQIVREISIPATDRDNILIRAAEERRSFNIQGGRVDDRPIKEEVLHLLGVEDFAVVPIGSPLGVQGVIIADNFVTRQRITGPDVTAMELFANQAGLAIEKSKLYSELAQKVTALEGLNEELKESRDLMIRAERMSALGEMAAQIAHEIRNPLTSIGGLARFIQRHLTEEKYKKHLEIMVKETMRLEKIISQVFNFIESPPVILKKGNLTNLLLSCLQTLQSHLDKSHIELVTALAPNLPELNLDEYKMKDALVSLLRNALEAMPSGGQLKVATWATPEGIKLEIRDTGTGMDPEGLKKAREPFFTTKTYGIGLGLTLVDKIVKAHQGQLDLAGKFGTGVCVTISLPVTPG